MYTGLASTKILYLILAFSFVASTEVVAFDVSLATIASAFPLFLAHWPLQSQKDRSFNSVNKD